MSMVMLSPFDCAQGRHAKQLQSPFDRAHGRHGLVGLNPDPSTPPGFTQEDKVRGRAFAKSELVEGSNHTFGLIPRHRLLAKHVPVEIQRFLGRPLPCKLLNPLKPLVAQ